MPRTKQQFSEMRATARQKIMQAAMELFSSQGYHAASISMIASKAGVSKGLMYNYFEGKEELLREIVFSGIEEISKGFDINRDGTLTREELLHFIRESFRMVKSQPDYWKLYFLLIYQTPALNLFQAELREVVFGLLGVLDRYFEENGYENPAAESRFFSAMLDGVCMNFLFHGTGFPVDEIEDKIIKMYS